MTSHFRRDQGDATTKMKAALAAGLMPIVCIGETLADREAGRTEGIWQAVPRIVGALTAEFCVF